MYSKYWKMRTESLYDYILCILCMTTTLCTSVATVQALGLEEPLRKTTKNAVFFCGCSNDLIVNVFKNVFSTYQP